jgi:hypothetical protein
MFYATLYLRHVLRIRVPFEQYSPALVPVASAAGVTTFVAFLLGLWPAYGFLTPIVVGVLGMGAIFVWHFIPGC